MLETLSKLYIAGVHIDFKQFHRFHPKRRVNLPFYPFQRKQFWATPQTYTVSKKLLNPLLGSKVDSPKTPDHDFFDTTRQTRFQNFITLQTHGYVGDHKVGKFPLMPGAGFIEAFLAATSASTVLLQEFPIILEDLVIQSPFLVENVLPRELHTVLTVTEEEDKKFAKLTAFGRDAEARTSASWNIHSESVVNLERSSVQDISEELKVEELSLLMERLCIKEPTSPELYKEMAAQGYNFGKLFQTLGATWIGNTERLIEVLIPSDLQDERDMCHPILVDAMIQAFLMSGMKKLNGLYLPVGVKKFVLLDSSFVKLETNQTSSQYFLHVKGLSPTSTEQCQVVLYQGGGPPIAYISGVDIVKTQLAVLEKKLAAMKKLHVLPPLFQQEWQLSNSFSSSQIHTPFLKEGEAELQKIFQDNPTDHENDAETHVKIEEYVSTNIILALYQLGMKEEAGVGEIIDLIQLMEKCKILKEMYMPTRRLLEVLGDEGYLLQSDENRDIFKIVKVFPSWEKIKQIREYYASDKVFIYKTNTEKRFHIYAMERLGSFLSGKESILTHMFPEDEKKEEIFSASAMYNESELSARNYVAMEPLLPALIRQCLENTRSPDGKVGLLRILEIGAGTGSATKVMLKVLNEMNVKYSYTFTDISNAFFVKARETFKPYLNNMKFNVFNVEDDPKTQGLAPNQFDLVIAANVLHATQNLTDTSRNTRFVMKPFGVFLLIEIFIPQSSVDSMFGLLPGYWRQKDLDLRPTHCLINEKKWSKLFAETGFLKDSLIFPLMGGRTGIVMAQASPQIEQYIPPTNSKTANSTWLIFGDVSAALPQNISKRISLHGKSVIFVQNHSEGFKEDGENYKIRGNFKEDFIKLCNSLKQRSILEDVEGLIVTWGVTPTNPKECIETSIFFIESFLYLLQTLLDSFPRLPKLLLVTRGVVFHGDQSPVSPAASPMLGMIRSFLSESKAPAKFIDLSPDEDDLELEASEVVSELWSDFTQAMLSYTEGHRHELKLTVASSKLGLPYPPLDLETSPSAKRFHILHAPTHSIADLEFETHNNKPVLDPFMVEVEIKASALNFKDVLCVLKPSPEFDTANCIGIDACGIVVAVGPEVTLRKVGDSVIGCNFQDLATPSHIVMHERHTVALPQEMTYAEGATLPTVFLTSFHCLVTVANLKAGETILIHTASGGVGLCAVQLARKLGANIVATAGSRRKRNYLRAIGLKHVFHSRDLTFGEGIMQATNGRGVDMVLNSITGPGFKETSLKSCSKNARFVEMSKLNIWSEKEVQEMRPDIKYSIVDLGQVNGMEEMSFLFSQLEKHLYDLKNPLKALPYTRFDVTDVRSGLNYLEKAKQIGKVVCVYPEPPTKETNTLSIKLFNDRSTYLITGGCGGIGFEVCKWMCDNGARTVCIVGRKLPSAQNLKIIESLNKQGGKNILVVQGDVGDKTRCQEIIEWIKKDLPPLRGIMHSAGCLSDGIISNQTMEKFEITMNPKIRGTWNLHSLTLDCDLEHFVMFSSVVALVGSLGQSNHAASNAYMDSIVNYRRSMRLAASTINWGLWGEVGIAVGRELFAALPMTTKEGLNALGQSLRTNTESMVAMDFDPIVLGKMMEWLQPILELLSIRNVEEKFEVVSSELFWLELNEAEEDEGQRYAVIQKYISKIILRLLRLDDDVIEANQNFQDMGLDSLMMIELKNQLQGILGSNFTLIAAEMADCKTLHLTTEKVKSLIFSRNSEGLSIQSRNQLITEDSKLWETIDISKSLPPIPINEVEVVLMTGCTGTLCPYIIQQLTQYKQIKKMYCLVRPMKSETSKNRLFQRLKYLHLLDKTDTSKIFIVEGNVTEDLLGIEESLYKNLSSEVGAIIHCAVHTSHLEMYGRGASKRTGIRAVNVEGTQRVLEFASKTLVKHVYSGSSLLGAFTRSETVLESDTIPSNWPQDGDADEAPSFGYGISKFIADRLTGEAVKIGIPCKVFRYPKIVGEKDTGRQEVKDNHFFIKFIYFMQSGIMPDNPIPLQVVPVDTCAEVSLRMFLNPQVSSELFNIINPHHNYETDMVTLGEEYGPLLKVAEQLWKVVEEIKELQELAKLDSSKLNEKFLELLNKHTKEMDIDLEPIMELMGQVSITQDLIDNPSKILMDERVRAYLKENYGKPIRAVPYEEFLAQLKKDGERTELYKWIDFYQRDDSIYTFMNNKLYFGQQTLYKSEPEAFLQRSCAKLFKYMPDYDVIVPNGLEIVKRDFEFAVENAVEMFRRSDATLTNTLKEIGKM